MTGCLDYSDRCLEHGNRFRVELPEFDDDSPAGMSDSFVGSLKERFFFLLPTVMLVRCQ